MGAVKKLLSARELPERELHNSRMFVDLAENVHIHFRELRLLFGIEEFEEFCQILERGAKDVRRYLDRNPDYREQVHSDAVLIGGGARQQMLPLKKSPRPHQSKYFPNRLAIELQEERVIDSIHIHYRDYRLAMNFATFRELALGMSEALAELEEYLGEHDYDELRHPFRAVVSDSLWPATEKSRFRRLMEWLQRRIRGW